MYIITTEFPQAIRFSLMLILAPNYINVIGPNQSNLESETSHFVVWALLVVFLGAWLQLLQ